MDRPDRARLGVGLATLTGLVIRVWYVLAVRRHRPVLGDAYYFHHAANLLVDGKGWIVPLPYHALGQTQQAADHPPVFVVYLAMWSKVGLTSVTAHLVAGALLGTVAVALVGVVGYRVGGWRVATVAAAFAAVYPNLWGWDGMLLSEPTAVIAVTLVLLTALRFDESPTTWRAVAFGLTIGFAGLCRAELLLLGPLVALPLAIRARGELGRAAIGRFAAIGVVAVAVVAPWVGYNLTRFEEPVFLSAGLDVTLAYSNCDPAFYGPNTGYFDFSCAALPDLTPEELEELDQSERSTLWRERATSYIRDHLDRLPTVVLARLGHVAGVYQPFQQMRLDVIPEGREVWVAHGGMAGYYALVVLSVAGWHALRRSTIPRFVFLMPIVTAAFAAMTTFGATRYRAAAEPVLCLLGAAGAVALFDVARRMLSAPPEPVGDAPARDEEERLHHDRR